MQRLVGQRIATIAPWGLSEAAKRRWTGTLSVFLDRLTRHISTRVCREQSPGGERERETSDEEDEQMDDVSPAGQPVTARRAPLSEDTQRRVAGVIVKLASKAQYAKASLAVSFITLRFPHKAKDAASRD